MVEERIHGPLEERCHVRESLQEKCRGVHATKCNDATVVDDFSVHGDLSVAGDQVQDCEADAPGEILKFRIHLWHLPRLIGFRGVDETDINCFAVHGFPSFHLQERRSMSCSGRIREDKAHLEELFDVCVEELALLEGTCAHAP